MHTREQIENERIFYVHSKLLNNVLLGSSRTWIDQQRALADVKFECDLDHCYLILTGIPRESYQLCGEDDSSYFEEEYGIKKAIDAVALQLGYSYHLLYHNVTKEICIIASAKTQKAHNQFLSFVESIHHIVSDALRITMPRLEGRCANVTVYCGPVSCYEEISGNFSSLMRLKTGSFFDMHEQILTQALQQKRVRAIHPSEASSLADEVNDAVLSADFGRAFQALRALFLDKLKHGYDLRILRDTTSQMHSIVQGLALRYGFEIPVGLFETADIERACSIEELHSAVERLLQEAIREIKARERPIPLIVREALRFIRKEYKGNLSLDRASQIIHVSPEHLSRTFKSAMHQGYLEYVREYRLKLAAERLSGSDMPISAIARDVGMTDESHFYRLFRQTYGVSPGVWREQNRSMKEI